MNQNLIMEITRSSQKIVNLRKQMTEINEKLNKLQEHIKGIEASIEKEEKHLSLLGLKQPRRDGKPETEEEKTKKQNYNDSILRQKLDLIQKMYPEEYKTFEEKICPTLLKDSYLQEKYGENIF